MMLKVRILTVWYITLPRQDAFRGYLTTLFQLHMLSSVVLDGRR